MRIAMPRPTGCVTWSCSGPKGGEDAPGPIGKLIQSLRDSHGFGRDKIAAMKPYVLQFIKIKGWRMHARPGMADLPVVGYRVHRYRYFVTQPMLPVTDGWSAFCRYGFNVCVAGASSPRDPGADSLVNRDS
jgi:hypothetical protein